jgi:hypothetical protein
VPDAQYERFMIEEGSPGMASELARRTGGALKMGMAGLAVPDVRAGSRNDQLWS